ncbi:MAG: GlsB/YeaQ/YmgE family stress response membrane protein [Uliginosibacterium sp.]|jgi:uncharacterized membrane protein YeaQ/YmgE (transglycosylase-associated protein family)|nr:GlsB/YeaQ/YmgE family stress response membrane protein [Uliginosibacterium sp.]
MNFTEIILIGVGIGVAARVLRPNRSHMSLWLAIALSVSGALIATLGGNLLGLYGMGEMATTIGAVAGAILTLFMAALVRHR